MATEALPEGMYLFKYQQPGTVTRIRNKTFWVITMMSRLQHISTNHVQRTSLFIVCSCHLHAKAHPVSPRNSPAGEAVSNTRPVRVWFVVHEATLWQNSLQEYFGFTPVSIIPPIFRIHPFMSPTLYDLSLLQPSHSAYKHPTSIIWPTQHELD